MRKWLKSLILRLIIFTSGFMVGRDSLPADLNEPEGTPEPVITQTLAVTPKPTPEPTPVLSRKEILTQEISRLAEQLLEQQPDSEELQESQRVLARSIATHMKRLLKDFAEAPVAYLP